MLETMRQHSRSVFIYILFGILIAVFIISFGPQSGTKGSGCSSPSGVALRVEGREVSETSWRFGIQLMSGGNASSKKARAQGIRETVMDALIKRELLANLAEGMGFRISDAEVEERIAKGEMYVLGNPVPGRQFYFVKDPGSDEERFDDRRLERVAQNYGLPTLSHYVEEQRREMLAQKARMLFISAARVAPEELLQRYEIENTSAAVEMVRFEPVAELDKVEFTAADVAAYLAAHEAEIKKEYDEAAVRYQNAPKQVHLRHILVKKPEPSGDDTAATQPASAPATAPASAPAKPGAAAVAVIDPKVTAEQALAKLNGGADFAVVARELSQDSRTRLRGGDLGWIAETEIALGAETLAAIAALKDGQTSGVIDTARGYRIVRVEGRREGNLSFDQVKSELAEKRLISDRSREMAKGAAEKALAEAKAGKTLAELFPPLADGASGPELVATGELRRYGGRLSDGSMMLTETPELGRAIFTSTDVGGFAPVLEVEGAFVVLRVVTRTLPDMAKFEADKERLREELSIEKAQMMAESWATSRCVQARNDGQIYVEPRYVEYPEDADEKNPPAAYVPCQRRSRLR